MSAPSNEMDGPVFGATLAVKERAMVDSKSRANTKTKKVAVIGFGTIGTGVVDLLHHRGVPGLELVTVVDKDLDRKRAVTVPPGMLVPDLKAATDNPAVDIVVELMGGIEPAKTVLLTSLRNGKDVVTANKKLLAKEGSDIFQTAATLGRKVGFRASFVGAHSLIHEFRQAKAMGRRFRKIQAILNGTSNYVLSTMSREGRSFDEALKEAQAKGFAEFDPSDDIDGLDTASKVRILLGLIADSYHTVGPFPLEGIRGIAAQDIQYAAELGYVVKLVGTIEQNEGVFNVSVRPALVPAGSLLGSLQGAMNGIELEDDYNVVTGMVAPGAGTYPTAESVVKDLLDIVEGRPMPAPASAEHIPLGRPDDMQRRFYLRFSVLDQAGVLAQICNIFWQHNISIAAVIQKEAVSAESVPVVITTHVAGEGDLQAAIEQVDRMDAVKAKTKVMRILRAET
jgi:homoserine dehydrogenase